MLLIKSVYVEIDIFISKRFFIGLNVLVLILNLCIFIMIGFFYLEKYIMLILELYYKYLNFEFIKGLFCCKYCFELFIDKCMNYFDIFKVECVYYIMCFYCFVNVDRVV